MKEVDIMFSNKEELKNFIINKVIGEYNNKSCNNNGYYPANSIFVKFEFNKDEMEMFNSIDLPQCYWYEKDADGKTVYITYTEE